MGYARAVVVVVAIVAILAVRVKAAPPAIDPKLPDYKAVTGVDGSIKSVGSDTMNNLMTLWQEGFRQFYPSVAVEIEGKGSSTAPVALISGTATFGPMSRMMKPDEIDKFEKKFGYKPVQLPTSIDMLAIYVHQDNPLKSLTLAQADAIFSRTRRRGHATDIRTWGQLGLGGTWGANPISTYGRNSASGTYIYFKEVVLANGDFKDSVKEQAGSAAVVQAVAGDRMGIGYSGIGYKTPNVRPLLLAMEEGDEPIAAEPEHAYSGDYPLARPLLLSLNYRPGSSLDPLRREFIRYVFSKQGQQQVIKDGYVPLTHDMATKALQQVGIVAANK